MKHFLSLGIIVIIHVNSFSQSNELKGKWILDRVLYQNGQTLEINNEMYSSEVIYTIKKNEIQINNQKLSATYTENQIQTTFKRLNYSFEQSYLKVVEVGSNKVYYFLKVADFTLKYPEFKMKEQVIGADTLSVANTISDYEFIHEKNFDDFIRNKMVNRPSKEYDKLYFKIEFELTKKNQIRRIKILNSISKEFDNQYSAALKKAEPFFKNNTQKNLLITKEINHIQFYKDIKDPNERKLFDILEKADANYSYNEFNEAIVEYNKIKQLQIKENHYKLTISEALIKLAISYLAIGDRINACKNFNQIGDVTDFRIRNYLVDFCKEK